MGRPVTIWPLLLLLLFLGIGGLYGGVAMLVDPSGGLLRLSEVLPLLPVTSFILPGLFLLIVMGLIPMLLIYGLLARPSWNWFTCLSDWSRHHWSWTGVVALCLVLAIWLTIQGFLIGFKWGIQYITAITGGLILLFAFIPNLRKYYSNEA